MFIRENVDGFVDIRVCNNMQEPKELLAAYIAHP
jgi:hypothetical protein